MHIEVPRHFAVQKSPLLSTHGTYGLRYVFCASVFCAYSVFSDKQNTVQSFEGASVLCIVYCVFSCQSVFTPEERLAYLGGVPYSVFRIPYWEHHFGWRSVFRIPYSVLGAPLWVAFRIPYSVFRIESTFWVAFRIPYSVSVFRIGSSRSIRASLD